MENGGSGMEISALGGAFIGGSFVEGKGDVIGVHDPSTGECFARLAGASSAQHQEAIDAARRAFDEGPWPRMSARERSRRLLAFAEALDARREQFIDTLVAETGAPRTLATNAQFGLAREWAFDLTELAGSLPSWEHNELPLSTYVTGGSVRLSVRHYEPVGVVSAITAYNFPLVTNISKVVPALAVGCTVVLRPSPLTPLTALALGRLAQEADIPDGVLNVVVEPGAEGAQLLSSAPEVDLVSFTGSVGVGRQIAAQAAPTLKRLVLELGGKSVQLHLPDVLDGGPDHVVRTALAVFRSHAGQSCSLQTRVLVPEASKAGVLDALAAAAEALVVGEPNDPRTDVGPVISGEQRGRIESLVADGVAAGAEIRAGGKRPQHMAKGWYFEPTVVAVDDNANPLAQHEVFGPVVTVQGYRDVDDAVAIANDSSYGLAGAVYTDDLDLGIAVATRIRSGTVQVNGGGGHAYAAIGGVKQSGIGHERGVLGIRAFQVAKHMLVGTR